MNKTKQLIEKIIDSNNSYDKSIKNFADNNIISPKKMRSIVEGEYNSILEKGNLREDILDFIENYNFSMMGLVKGLDIKEIDPNEIGVLAGYVENLEPEMIERLKTKDIKDIALFIKLSIQMTMTLKTVSNLDKKFYYEFSAFVFGRE